MTLLSRACIWGRTQPCLPSGPFISWAAWLAGCLGWGWDACILLEKVERVNSSLFSPLRMTDPPLDPPPLDEWGPCNDTNCFLIPLQLLTANCTPTVESVRAWLLAPADPAGALGSAAHFSECGRDDLISSPTSPRVSGGINHINPHSSVGLGEMASPQVLTWEEILGASPLPW